MKKTIQQIPHKAFGWAMILSLFTISCAVKPARKGMPLRQARWESKAVIKNLNQGRVDSLTIDILAIREQQARFEISGLFGIQLASLVMDPRQIRFVYYPQKKFYYGENSETVLTGLIHMPLHPMNLSRIAFDEPLMGAGWKCQDDKEGWVSECENSARKLNVRWLNRDGGAKRVLITAPGFEMTWHFDEPRSTVQFKPNTFTLNQPEGYQVIHIR